MKENFWENEKGAAAVLTGIMFAALAGFVALSIDVGNLYLVKSNMQNAVDAAVCGGGLVLPNHDLASSKAKALIESNGFDDEAATITFTQDAVSNPGNAPEINCILQINARTYFMGLFGFRTVPIKASAEGILIQSSPGGPFNYSIFSADPLSTFELTLNGTQNVKGSVHSNDQLCINGSSTVSGSAEGVTGVTINGSNNIGSVMADTLNDITINGSNTIGSKSGGASNIAMPDYSTQIANTAATTYNSSQTFNGTVNVTGNIYVKGDVTLNGSINTSGAILSTGNITVNGTSSIGGSNQVCLYSATGNITINGTSFNDGTSSEIMFAPKGQITVNGSMTFHGRIIGYKVTINGSETVNGNDYPVTTLPGKSHVKLIK
jgi:cytoskeletal protein CcmA (bactofilin family)